MNLLKRFLSLLGEDDDFGVGSPYLERSKSFQETHSLGELLPYLSFDEGSSIFQNRESVGFVLETVPMVGSGDDIQQRLEGLIQHTLPLGSNLQILLIASPRLHDFFERWKCARADSTPMLNLLAKERAGFLDQFSEENKEHQNKGASGSKLIRTFRVIISYSEPMRDGYKTEKAKPDTVSRKRVGQGVKQVLKQIKTTFEGFGLPVREWHATDLIQTLDMLFNINQPPSFPLNWDEESSLSNQIFSPNFHLKVGKGELTGSTQTIRTYSVRVFPNTWYLGAMGTLIGDPFNNHLQIPVPFFIHYGVHIVDEMSLRAKIEAKTGNLERLSHNSTLMKWVPSMRREVEEGQFLRRMLDEGQRAVRTRFQVGLIGNDLDDAEQSLINLFRSQLWELERDKLIVLPSLLSCLPMTWGEGMYETNLYFKTTKTTLSHEPANLFPIQGEWMGTRTPGMILVCRRGQAFYWSPFDNNAGNYNVIVVGRSGSGKSVFMQELMTATLGLGGRVFVLDVGRSFEKTAKLLNGSYIEFSTRSNICINPFSSIPLDAGEHTNDALAMVKPLIALMAAPLVGTNDLENAYIEQALNDAWNEKKNEASITEVADFLLKHSDKIAQDLGNKLYAYTKDGVYGRFFNGKANVDLTSSLTVLELEELKERKDLQAVVVQVVILQITNQLYMGDRKTKAHLVLDEAWDLLKAKQAGAFIETAARRLRKYNGSLVVGTQSVNDFYETPGAQAAFDNSDWLCLLSQKNESIEILAKTKRLSMDDPYKKSLLKSVHTKQGEYAEVMICGPGESYEIGRLILDPFSKVLYSTKAEDYARVQALEAEGLPLEDAVRAVAYGRNVVTENKYKKPSLQRKTRAEPYPESLKKETYPLLNETQDKSSLKSPGSKAETLKEHDLKGSELTNVLEKAPLEETPDQRIQGEHP